MNPRNFKRFDEIQSYVVKYCHVGKFNAGMKSFKSFMFFLYSKGAFIVQTWVEKFEEIKQLFNT
jgi:hypothetical protein